MRHAAAVAVLLLCSATAAADVLDSALGQPLTEVSHSVDVSVKDGIAIYKVRRVFANGGTVADEARLEIDLPYGGAATGLRIRARDRWFDGELMEAEAAAKLYHELTGRGLWKPKDPALLYWRWADKLALQIFPVLPGSTSTVEYTLTVPTRYHGGRVYLSYPRLAADDAAHLAVPVFTIRPGWGDATTAIQIDGARVAPDAPLVLAAPAVGPGLEGVELDPSASYVASRVEVEASPSTRHTFRAAKVTIDLEHTYRSDLRVALYPPRGDAIEIFDGSGGGDNDVRGTFPIELPPGTVGAGTWRLVVSDHAALDAGTLESWSLELGDGKREKPVTVAALDTPIFVPDAPENASDGGVAMIALAPPPIDAVATRFGKVVASAQHAFARLEVDAAPELRPLPKKPQVVFAIDASYSVGDDGIALQLAVARAYLSHVPDAEVEVVAYRRTASRVFDEFVPAADFARRVELARSAGRLAPGNGSALDEGARIAATALAGRRGALRIVITTPDDSLRTRFANPLAIAALRAAPAGTVVHVVETRGDDELALTRDDAHPLAAIALANHGIGAYLTGVVAGDKHLPAAVLGLVRPMRVDHFAVRGLDLAKGHYDDTVPDVLDEGAGFRIVVDAPVAPDRVELTGMIGDPFHRVVTTDAAFSKAAAAWVFSEDDHQDLSPEEMMTVALMGRAVSPVTSYVAYEPGTRPLTIGLEETSEGFGVGDGMGGLMGGGSADMITMPPDPMALVADGARRCVEQHHPAAGWSVKLDLETTLDEVVDVVPGAGADTPLGACLVEAVWAIRLDAAFHETRAHYPLDFH